MSRSCRFNVHCPCSCLFQLIQTGIEASVQKAKDSCLTPACFQPRFSSVPRPPAFGQRALSTGRRGAASQTLVLFLGYLFCDPPSWCFNIFLAINYDLLFWSSDVRPNCQEPFPLAGEESSLPLLGGAGGGTPGRIGLAFSIVIVPFEGNATWIAHCKQRYQVHHKWD